MGTVDITLLVKSWACKYKNLSSSPCERGEKAKHGSVLAYNPNAREAEA